MSLRVIPRRSVKIEAWDATNDDILKVETRNYSPRMVYYLRPTEVSFGHEASFYFDREFIPDDVLARAREAASAEVRYRDILGPDKSTESRAPTEEEVAEELEFMLMRSGRITNLDYDRGLELDFIYYMNQRIHWSDPNPVQNIAWITREQARKERAEALEPTD